MEKQLQLKLADYSTWIDHFEFDAVYGYLIDPSYQPKSFDYSILLKVLSELGSLNANGKIIETVNNLPEISIKMQSPPPHKDMLILHDACSYLIHSYIKVLKDRSVQEADIVVPKNLAVPLAQSASLLKIKTGMATGICYNWYFNDQIVHPNDLTLKDIGFKAYFSNTPEHESIFFGVSVLTCCWLSQIIRLCYEINSIVQLQPNLEDEITARMRTVKSYWHKIFNVNMHIHQHLSKEFFFYVLRAFVAGYQNVYFEGLGRRVSSSGGAGGYDPSFQTFERAFGIKFDGELADIQSKLRNGMTERHRSLIDFMAENSLIRQYCECSPQLQASYNEVIESYVKYLELHGTFIKNFIIHFMPVNTTRSSFGATGATMIKIIDRFRFVREQQLK